MTIMQPLASGSYSDQEGSISRTWEVVNDLSAELGPLGRASQAAALAQCHANIQSPEPAACRLNPAYRWALFELLLASLYYQNTKLKIVSHRETLHFF